jgi:methyltransferase
MRRASLIISPALIAALVAFVVIVIAQRVWELALSARHARRLQARGGIETDAGHFPLLVLVHVLFPVCIVAEVVWLGARPGALWIPWMAAWVAAHGLRFATMRALGDRWTVRIFVVPNEPLVRRGPYRFLRHPNYVAVVVELASGALMFGAWRSSVIVSLLNAVALTFRVRAEDRALGF